MEERHVQPKLQNLTVKPNHLSLAITLAPALIFWWLPKTIIGGLFTLATLSMNAMWTTSRRHKTLYWKLWQSIRRKAMNSMNVCLFVFLFFFPFPKLAHIMIAVYDLLISRYICRSCRLISCSVKSASLLLPTLPKDFEGGRPERIHHQSDLQLASTMAEEVAFHLCLAYQYPSHPFLPTIT